MPPARVAKEYRINGIRVTLRTSGSVYIGAAPCYVVWKKDVPEGVYHRRPPHAAVGEAALEAVLLAATASPEKVKGWGCGKSL